MHRARRLSGYLDLQHLVEGPLEKRRKYRKMYRPQSMLRRPADAARRFFSPK